MAAATAPTCGGCRRPIQGASIAALGQVWHPRHFMCALCGQPIQGRFRAAEDGQPAHEACWLASRAPRCKACAQPIPDIHMTDLWGEKSCPACHRACRCEHCGGAGAPVAGTSQQRCHTCNGVVSHRVV